MIAVASNRAGRGGGRGKRSTLSLLATLIAALGNGAGAQTRPFPPDTTPLAFVHVAVLPMDSAGVLEDQTVLVRGGKITTVGASATIAVPPAAKRIEGRGMYLMPGLVDAHVHYLAQDPLDDPYADAITRQFSTLFVLAGVTEVLDLCGSPWALTLREQIMRGEVLGPTMLTSPDCLGEPDMTAAQGTLAVSNAKVAGYDFLKVYSFLSKEGFTAIAAAAKRVDMPVIGHIPLAVGLQPLLDAGVVGIAHAEEFLYNPPFKLRYGGPDSALRLDPANIPTVAHAMHVAGAAVSPTLITYNTILDEGRDLTAVLVRPEMMLVSPETKSTRGWYAENNDRVHRLSDSVAQARLRLGLGFQRKLVRAFQDSGVTILAGTNAGAGIPLAPGISLHQELQALVTAGLTPYQALRAGTASAGEWLSRYFHAVRSGVVREGARADLVLLDANPLTDITNTKRIRGVVLRGSWLSHDELQRRTRELTARYGKHH